MLSAGTRKVLGLRYVDEEMSSQERKRRHNVNQHLLAMGEGNQCDYQQFVRLIGQLSALETDEGLFSCFHKNSETIGLPCTHAEASLFHTILKRPIFSGEQKANLLDKLGKKGYSTYFGELLRPELAQILLKESPSYLLHVYLKLLTKNYGFGIDQAIEQAIWDSLIKDQSIQEGRLMKFFGSIDQRHSRERIMGFINYQLANFKNAADVAIFYKTIKHSISQSELKTQIKGLVDDRMTTLTTQYQLAESEKQATLGDSITHDEEDYNHQRQVSALP
jgi:hypothetical protein